MEFLASSGGIGMKLTGRQQDILSQFLDLYRENQHSLHYSIVAEKLGVSPATAYEMLRLLEKRGLLTSEYVLSRERGGGRSTIVFSPTQKAVDLMAQLAGENWDQEEWEETKEHILRVLRACRSRDYDYQNLLDEILLRLPEHDSPMRYAAEMITAILLCFHELGLEARASALEGLRALGFPREMWLHALAGLAVGLSFAEQANRCVISPLLSHAHRYHEHLAELGAENRRQLSDFGQEVMRVIDMS
jgi:DNA-binding PadR family transcriptional regulator